MDDQPFTAKTWDLIKRINICMMAEGIQFCKKWELTPQQFAVLKMLTMEGCMKVGDLSNIMGTPDSNISLICRRLEKRALLKRERDESDQRIVYIKLTEQAVALMKEMSLEMHKMHNTLENVSEADKRTIMYGLERLYDILEEAKKLKEQSEG